MAERFGIAACAILKNFSTVLTSIMCYLYDIASYENFVQDMMQDTWDFRHCGNKNEFFGAGGQRRIEMAKMQSKLNLWRYYVLTREPMERFISGFLDKCVIKAKAKNKTVPTGTSCYGCKGDLACFIKAQYNSFLVATRGGKPGYSMENEHFAPQTWYCQLGSHFSEYRFFHYSHPTTGQMLDELFDEFEALGVPKRVGDRVKEQVIGKRTYHSTYQTGDRMKYTEQLKNDPMLLETFLKMYFYDYVYLGYPLPNVTL
ncbi:unnamed protein product, partial [Mesorhabditis spiculigera]